MKCYAVKNKYLLYVKLYYMHMNYIFKNMNFLVLWSRLSLFIWTKILG